MIDILMATYNGEAYLAEQIESILAQTESDWRILFHDDGSSDRTIAMIESYREHYPDKMVLISDGKTYGGACQNFMHLVQLAESDYAMFCDQDDVWNPDKLEITLKKLKELESQLGGACDDIVPILVCTDVSIVDQELHELPVRESQLPIYRNNPRFNKLLVQNYYMGCTMMFNRALYQKVQEVPEHVQMHDWWMVLLAVSLGRFQYIPVKTMKYRQHGDNSVGAAEIGTLEYLWKKLHSDSAGELCNRIILQARDFSRLYHDKISAEDQGILDVLVHLRDKSKLVRVYEQCKYGILKGTLFRAIGQLIYM